MKNIWIVASWEFITRLRSKWFIISVLIMPIIIVASMFVPTWIMTGEDTESRIVAIVDETGYLGNRLDVQLAENAHLKDGNPKYQVVLFQNAESAFMKKQAAELLDSSVIASYLVIPADIKDSLRVQYYAKNVGNFKDQSEIANAFNEVVSSARMQDAGLNVTLIRSLTKHVDFKMIEVEKEGVEKEGNEMLSYLTPIIFVLMLFFAIFMSSQILLRSVLMERTNRLVEILLSSITPTELMSGKIIGLGFLGLAQLALYLIVGYYVSSSQGVEIITSANTIYFLIYFILGYLFYAGIFASVGAIFNSEQDAQQAVSILSFITVIPIMMSSYVIANPDSVVSIVCSFIPFVTPFFMILRIGVETPPVWEILSTVATLGVFTWLAMVGAGKIFRVALLMYGKRPTLPELMQWIREK
ncbi:MAG: ABC transporter permease [Candidatus Marinimicrobia bacterium]|nr:ABC transporter permease [Candidatus Neomarinimicrobiota bacterium]